MLVLLLLIILLYFFIDRAVSDHPKAKEYVDIISLRAAAFSLLILSVVRQYVDVRQGSIPYCILSGAFSCLKIRSWCQFWTLITIQTAGVIALLWYHLAFEVSVGETIKHENILQWNAYAWYAFHFLVVVMSPFFRFMLLSQNQTNRTVRCCTWPITYCFDCWSGHNKVFECCPSWCFSDVEDPV